jgi:hypothetical protein
MGLGDGAGGWLKMLDGPEIDRRRAIFKMISRRFEGKFDV